MNVFAHPLWLVGFRPFFILTCLSGLSLPLVWVLMYAGVITMPLGAYPAAQWHAHEMFFGFGGALLGGFLLTATKNWVKIRGWHGGPLAFLTAAWLFERAGMWLGGDWPPALFLLSNQLFIVTLVSLLMWSLVRHRTDDGYRRDNLYFLVALPLFLLPKPLMMSTGHALAGNEMVLGLFRLTFLIMLERTLTDFMRNVFKVTILRRTVLDDAIKVLALVMVFAGLLPSWLAGTTATLLAALLLVRFMFWHPRMGFSRIDIGVMYLGYLGICAQLLMIASAPFTATFWVGSVATHLFTFGVMGLIAPAMIVRISKGHTGRKVMFDAIDKGVLWVMIVALLLRVVAPQVAPALYPRWLELAATCWFLAFATLAWRSIPLLIRPRIDGRDH